MRNSISQCNSCAAPMCKWQLKMEISEGMVVTKETRTNAAGKERVDTVCVVKKCPDYQKWEGEDEEE